MSPVCSWPHPDLTIPLTYLITSPLATRLVFSIDWSDTMPPQPPVNLPGLSGVHYFSLVENGGLTRVRLTAYVLDQLLGAVIFLLQPRGIEDCEYRHPVSVSSYVCLHPHYPPPPLTPTPRLRGPRCHE